MTFRYFRHQPKASCPSAQNGKRSTQFKNEPPEIFLIPEVTLIEAPDIIAADRVFEEKTGINPGRYKNHTPPITVSIQCPFPSSP